MISMPSLLGSPSGVALAVSLSVARASVAATTTGGVTPTPTPTPRPYTILIMGSSTTAKWFTENTGPANPNVTVSSDGINWSPLGTAGGGATVFGDYVSKALGDAPVRLIGKGQAATKLTEWETANSGLRGGATTAGKAAGGVDAVISIVDFNDALQNLVVSRAAHEAMQRSFISRTRTGLAQPNVPVILGIAQKYSGTTSAPDGVQFDWIHLGDLTVANDANNFFGAHAFDLPQISDGIHLQVDQYAPHARRLGANVVAAITGGTIEKGPRAVSVAAVYSTATDLTIAHSTGTDFTPTSGVTGLELSKDGFTTKMAITSTARVSPTKLRLYHADLGGAAPSVQGYLGVNPVTTGVLVDNSPRALPLNMFAPLTAPSGSTVVDPTTPTPTPTPVATGKSAKVAFSKSNAAPSGFTAIGDSGTLVLNSNAGLSKALLSPAGAATGWTLTSANAFQGGDNVQGTTKTGDDGVYPNAVMTGYWFTGAPVNNSNGNTATPSTTLNITGLDPTKRYTFKVFGSRLATNRATTFTAGGGSQNLECGNNVANTVSFVGLAPDSNGLLTLTWAPAPTLTYGYLSVLEITEFSA